MECGILKICFLKNIYSKHGSTMENVSPEDKAKITGLISVLVPNARIILFGSRARGTNSPRADIDVAVDAGEPLPRVLIDEAQSVIEGSNIMYRVEVVDFNRLSEEMRKAILSEGILWKH